MNKIKKIYYAHPITLYNTNQEEIDLALLKFLWPNSEIYNPNSKLDSEKYKKYGMDWFYDRIGDCDLVVFRPFPDGKIGAGVWGEIQYAKQECCIPVIEIPILLESRQLSIHDTREYIKHSGSR